MKPLLSCRSVSLSVPLTTLSLLTLVHLSFTRLFFSVGVVSALSSSTPRQRPMPSFSSTSAVLSKTDGDVLAPSAHDGVSAYGSLNVLGTALRCCCLNPRTGFYRDGCCETGPSDLGGVSSSVSPLLIRTLIFLLSISWLALARARTCFVLCFKFCLGGLACCISPSPSFSSFSRRCFVFVFVGAEYIYCFPFLFSFLSV